MRSAILALFAFTSLGLAQTYNESGGLVVMEIENTASPLGLWQKQTALAGHSGTGYLQFLGNTYESGPATSPLEFNFKINQAGLYHLHLHCAKETHDGRTDVANDCYVRVEGDYNAGPGPYTSHGDNASLVLLQSNTKYFGGATNTWKWESGQGGNGTGNLDPGGETNKRVAVYDFKADQTYKLVVSGRSKFFRINRIVFRHTNTAAATAQSLSTPESATVTTGTAITYAATTEFPNLTNGTVPYYKDNTRAALAIDASIVANRDKFARADRSFGGAAGSYDVTITALRELDGECTYRLLVNGVVVGTATNSPTTTDYAPQEHVFRNITIPAGATIAVESNTHSNGTIPETGGFAWARGRWTQIAFTSSTSLIKPPAGRLAIVTDGNSPDPDDIGANATIFGILRGAGLQDRLVHFSHSCDLVKATNISAADELRRQNYLHQTAGEGIGFFGPFNNLSAYYNCRTEQAAAVNNLRDAINASSASDPLWIIEAGEPDIIGYALQAATASKRQFVHVVSHHPANDDSGDFFTWAQILAFGVTEHQIGDQNVGLQVLISSGLWNWAENHPRPEIVWILDQLKYAEADGVVGFQTGKYDCSDAGMIYWWITGANQGGTKNSTPVEIREVLLNEPNQVVELLAGWDTWDSTTAPTVSATAAGISAIAAATGAGGNWSNLDTSTDLGRGSSKDGTWGSLTTNIAASTVTNVGPANLTLANAITNGEITFTITNGGSKALNLHSFNFDAVAFRDNAARTYQLNVMSGAITNGTVFTSPNDAITSLSGNLKTDDSDPATHDQHDEIDIDLTGLADSTLEAGGTVVFKLVFSSGTGSGAGHHLFLDNVGITHAVVATPVNPPQVNAGSDVSVTLPENQIDLSGLATDDGTIVSYLWTQVSGPNTASLTGTGTTNLSAGNLVEGTYVFRLSATDNENNTGTDDVTVTVLPASTAFASVSSFTLINADTDLPIAGFDPIANGATINKTSVGTSSFNIRVNTSPATDFGSVVMALSGATTKNTTESTPVWALFGDTAGNFNVGALNNGAHTFIATPYNQDAGAGKAGTPLTISFSVIDQAGAPTVNAGPDRVINLPSSQVTLDGSGTDDGSITAYAWTQVSGPNTATLGNPGTEDLTASGLIEGNYVFRLTVTDNQSNQAFDDASVSVVAPGTGAVILSGELKQWHKVTLTMDGPGSSETATPNPFSDYRMLVTFTHPGTGLSYVIPGYFAADGNAANTGATSGNKWTAHLSPDHTGTWNYTVSFRTGTDVAINSSPTGGTAVSPYDNTSGSFTIAASDKTGRDHRGKGRLQYVNKHHLRFAGTGEYFLKAGTDAPENLLAYDDIDATPNDQNDQPNLRKSWTPHAGDYDAADAAAYTWSGGRGSELLGAINYLSNKGVNVFSFLTFSLDGDDDNVFPHLLRGSVADYESVADNARWANTTKGVHKDRFDVSKMSQWENIFEYGNKKGMYLHFKTQETENDDRMDGGNLGRERKLYYRELVARYGHHLALNWNLGEENTNITAQQQAFAQWFRDNDPYRHNVVLHTFPLQKDTVYTHLLGLASKLTGLSLQGNQPTFSDVFQDTLTWLQNSTGAGTPWVVAYDEPGDAQYALRPASSPGNSWTDGRKNALWGNVMAGGAGTEFYFGYQLEQSDLTLQDYRSRDGFWDVCRHMLDFFRENNVSFQDMTNANNLVSGSGANANRCLAKPGETYVVQLYDGGAHTLNLSTATGDFTVRWFDPRNGGALQQGSVTSVTGGAVVSLGSAPSATSSDWIVLVTRSGGGGNTINGAMQGLLNDTDVRSDGVLLETNLLTLVPGRSGGSGGIDRSSVFVFQLPDLGSVASPFIAATLGFNVESVSTTPPAVDLYGLGKRISAEVLAGDYHGETAALDSTDATLIQSNILTGSTGVGFKNSSDGSALATYLNAQYQSGLGAGKFVFLRLSTTTPITGLLRHFITSADAAGENGPRISYTALAPGDFDTWLGSFAFRLGADLSPGGDPDGDGRTTRFEYLFALDPSDGASVSPITSGLSRTSGTFSYTRRNPALSGVTDYQIWISENLGDWSQDTAAFQTPNDEQAEVQSVEVSLNLGSPAPLTLFVQVRAGG